MLLATRKGLLQFERGNGAWRIARTDFPGVAVTAALADARDGTLYAMLKHGHFGSKLHRSDDGGANWTELPAPAFAADAAGAPDAVPGLDAGGRRRRRARPPVGRRAAGRAVPCPPTAASIGAR